MPLLIQATYRPKYCPPETSNHHLWLMLNGTMKRDGDLGDPPSGGVASVGELSTHRMSRNRARHDPRIR